MEKQELYWEEIKIMFIAKNTNQNSNDIENNIKKSNQNEYIFEIGCNVVKSYSLNSFICFNKYMHLNQKVMNTNEYFKVDELNDVKNLAINLYNKCDGPRFRITSIAGNQNSSQIEESYFFFGGIIAYNKEINIYLDDMWKFDLDRNSFFKINASGVRVSPRGGHSFTFYEEKNLIYLFGGKNDLERFNDVYEYDITKNTMRKIESLTNPPISRNNHTATICKNSLFVYGGWDGTKTLNDMYELSLKTYIWYPINYKGDLCPPSVYRHGTIAVNEKIILFGGVNEHNQKFNELFMFDMSDYKWSILPASGNYPSPRTYHNICYNEFISENNKREIYLYIYGGFSKSANNDCYSIRLSDNLISHINIDSKNSVKTEENELQNEKFNDKKDINNPHEISTHDENFINNSKFNTNLNYSKEVKDTISLLSNQVLELKQKYENEVMKNICKICFEKEINTVILYCCHKFVCYDCSFKCENRCPLCKGDIKEILKTYN